MSSAGGIIVRVAIDSINEYSGRLTSGVRVMNVKDGDRLAAIAILEPSAEIREGFGAYVAKLKDGQTLMGILVQQDAGGVTLKDMAGQKQTARTSQIEKLEALPQSLMPEGLLDPLSLEEIADLFAYLQRSGQAGSTLTRRPKETGTK